MRVRHTSYDTHWVHSFTQFLTSSLIAGQKNWRRNLNNVLYPPMCPPTRMIVTEDDTSERSRRNYQSDVFRRHIYGLYVTHKLEDHDA